MNSMAGASGPRIDGDGREDAVWNELVERDGDGERRGVRGGEGRERVEEDGEVASYDGGGTKLALTRRLPGRPVSRAACRSAA